MLCLLFGCRWCGSCCVCGVYVPPLLVSMCCVGAASGIRKFGSGFGVAVLGAALELEGFDCLLRQCCVRGCGASTVLCCWCGASWRLCVLGAPPPAITPTIIGHQ